MDEHNAQYSAPDAAPEALRDADHHDRAAGRTRRVLVGSVAAALVVGGGLGAGVMALTHADSASTEVAQAGSGQGQGQGQGQSGAPSFGGEGSSGQPSAGEGGPGQDEAEGFGRDGSDAQSDGQGGAAAGSGTGSSGADSAAGADTSYDTTTATTAATTSQSTGVVVVRTVTADGTAAGTGVVLTSSGAVVTNAHVVEGATRVVVTVPATGVSYEATVAGSSTASDIAVLELEGASGLEAATFDNDEPAVGDEVTAVGNAGGRSTLVAAGGEVQQLDATITTSAEQGESSETLTGVIAVDADVVAGDSGGALLDADGEVVGITTAATSGARDVIGYALPSQDVRSVVREILARVDS